jgi:hypothetical protein
MRSFCKLVTVMLALIGASIACAPASPALAATPLSHRYYTPHDIYGTPARQASRIFRCHGGHHYTYLGGWGCDYYVYSQDWPYGRRR